jgi:hypothetical protein
MGDSEGEPGAPEPAEHLAPDIRAALDAFAECASGIMDFTLCGLCDGASAALMYAPLDPRVRRLVLLNPWVSDQGVAARTAWRHYYLSRLADPELWRKGASGRFAVRASLRGLSDRVARGAVPSGPQSAEAFAASETGLRIDRGMTEALVAFDGRILLVLSSRDLTAGRYAGFGALARAVAHGPGGPDRYAGDRSYILTPRPARCARGRYGAMATLARSTSDVGGSCRPIPFVITSRPPSVSG